MIVTKEQKLKIATTLLASIIADYSKDCMHGSIYSPSCDHSGLVSLSLQLTDELIKQINQK